MESRQEAQHSLQLCLISASFPPESPNSLLFPQKNPNTLLSTAAASLDPNTKWSRTFSAGNHAEPAGTFRHLSFHFELEMGPCSVFQAAGAGEYFQGLVRKKSDRY